MGTALEHSGKPESAEVRVQNLRKSFGEQQVLKGISFEARHGQTVSVLGRSGTGKSVLLKLLAGLQAPDSGSIVMGNEEVQTSDEQKLNETRKKLGFLFQQAALYDSLTVEANVAFPLERHTRMPAAERMDKARHLLATVGIDDGLGKMPSEISGGMQKRVGLARALALDPEILLLDEPTAGLDPITAQEIADLILELKKQRQITAVVVTHDIRAARQFSDRLILLQDGTIAAEGAYAELRKSDNEFAVRFFRDEAECGGVK